LSGEKRIPRNAVLTVVVSCVVLDFLTLAVLKDGLASFVWWSNGLVFFATLTFTGVNIANLLHFRRILPEQRRLLANVVVPVIGAAANIYLIYAAFFSSLWSGSMATGKSVVIACVALLSVQIVAVTYIARHKRVLLSQGVPMAAESAAH